MKRAKKLTKKERKALYPSTQTQAPSGHHHHGHIHCTSCGRHLDEHEFESEPATAMWVSCQHQSQFSSCSACVDKTRALLEEHDRTGQPVRSAAAWH
jgi:Fe2+ or Zn2+ uptake regulation protein